VIDDDTAERFSNYMKKYPKLYSYLAEIVKKYSSSNSPFIIDLGVGAGLLSKELYTQISSAKILGVDPNDKMLKLAKKNVDFPGFEVKKGSSENIPSSDSSVDIVVSRFSLAYWKNPKESFKEIYRVLRKDGFLILEAINKDFPSWRLFLIKIHMLFNKAGFDVTKYHVDVYKKAYTISQVESFLLDSDFSIVEKQGDKKDWKFLIIGKKN